MKGYEVSYVLNNYLGLGVQVRVVDATNKIDAVTKAVPDTNCFVKCKEWVDAPLDFDMIDSAGLIEGYGGDYIGYIRSVANTFKKSSIPYDKFIDTKGVKK